MPGPNQPERPVGPTVKPSEPEQEQRALEHAIDTITDESSRKIIGLCNIRDALISAGLDVDEHGFIIRTDTGEYATPYMYSREAFKEIESPVENPIATYARPETDVTACILSKGRLHLSDLHSFVHIDGDVHPVRDDSMALQYMHMEIGFAFTRVTQWSDAKGVLDDEAVPGPDVIMNHPGIADHSLTLTCIRCDFTGAPDTWDGDADAPECPDCGGPWNTRGMEICTACQTTHWWGDIEHVGDGMHSEPRCPDCGADYHSLESQTHYDLFD